MHPLIVKNDAELNRLCKLFHVSRLELFGSGANVDFDRQTSDLDFLVDFEDLQPTAYADAYLGLLEALGHLFQRPIDLVTISAVKNPYFLKSIERSRQLCMRLETKKYLYDIQQAAERLTQFYRGKAFSDYSKDAMLRAAIERQFVSGGSGLHNSQISFEFQVSDSGN